MALANITITKRQDQVIRATILGGSSIVLPKNGRNCYLSMRGKNPKWLEYKARELNVLASHAPFTEEKIFRWHSMCYTVFWDFRNEFYENGNRSLKLGSIDPFQDLGLAIWYGDCGKTKNRKVIFNTNIWGEAGTGTILKYFKCLGYNVEIIMDRNCFRVKLGIDSSIEFLKLINPHMPTFI